MSKKDKREIDALKARLAEDRTGGVYLTPEEVAGLVCQLESKHGWDKVVGRRAQPAWDKLVTARNAAQHNEQESGT